MDAKTGRNSSLILSLSQPGIPELTAACEFPTTLALNICFTEGNDELKSPSRHSHVFAANVWVSHNLSLPFLHIIFRRCIQFDLWPYQLPCRNTVTNFPSLAPDWHVWLETRPAEHVLHSFSQSCSPTKSNQKPRSGPN